MAGPRRAWASLSAALEAQPARQALWAPVAVGFGCAAYFMLRHEPPPQAGVAAFVLAIVCLILAPRVLATRAFVLAIGLAALGFSAAVLRVHTVGAPIIPDMTERVEVSGRVLQTLGHSDGRPRVVIAPSTISGFAPSALPRSIRLAFRKTDPVPHPGDWLTVRAKLSPLPTPVSPSSYDFARAAYFNGIGGYGYVVGSPATIAPTTELGLGETVAGWVETVRTDAGDRIRAALPGSAGTIGAALIMGDQSQISQADMRAYRDSSLAHILSISGLHLAIVGLGLFGILRLLIAFVPWLALRINGKKWAAAAALFASFGYLLLSGTSTPAERSFLMIGLMFVAVLLDRSPFSLRIVAISAMIILLSSPESIVDPSFQMSFAAVTALIAAFESFEAWQVRRGRPLVMRDTWTGRLIYAVLIALMSSTIASLGTAPFIAFHFNRVAVYGVAANLVATPLVSFMIMPLAVVTTLALTFGLEHWPAVVMGWGIDAMTGIAYETAGWPGAADVLRSPPPIALAFITLGGLWIMIWLGRWRWLGLAPIAVALVLSALATPPDILIDRDAKTVAVRDDGGHLILVSGSRDSFAATDWLERDGDATTVADSAKAGRAGAWVCEAHLCVATAKGKRVGYLDGAGKPDDACRQRLDILISARAVPPCASGLTVTATDTHRNGALALRIEGDRIDVETTRDAAGDRAWTNWSP